MLLDEAGLAHCIAMVKAQFGGEPPEIICIDPIRNLFDGGPDGAGENDNTAMLFFLQQRVEALRDAVAPDAGLILCHHTKKLSKAQLKEDPFMALSGASALRSFYTSGIIMFRPDEERPERRLEIELRNGPALEPMAIDKRDGSWIEVNANQERLVRGDLGARLDAERHRKRDLIVQLLLQEAEKGQLYTSKQFAEAHENKAGLGGQSTIRERIGVLATKGHIKFLRDARPFGLTTTTSKLGYLVVEHMIFGPGEESADPSTGEITMIERRVQPSHFKAAGSGAVIEVENPQTWVYVDGELR